MAQKVVDQHLSFQLGLKVLRCIGFDPTNKTKITKMISLTSTLLILTVAIMEIIGLFGQKFNLKTFPKHIQTLSSLCLVITRQIILLLYSDEVKSVLNKSVFEWTDQNTNGKFYDLILKWFRALGVLIIINFLILLLKPWIVQELPMITYPSTNFWFSYCLQALYLLYATMIWYGFDLIFTMTCTYFINQLRHLRYFFENISFSDRNAMKEGVDRHVCLIRAIESVTKVYSLLFTTHIWITTTLICLEAYVDIKTENGIWEFVRHICVYLATVALISNYVITASDVTEEALKIAEAIYNSRWYTGDISARRYVMIVMLSANGFATISRLTIIFVLQTAFSYYTVLKTLNQMYPDTS